MTLTIRGIQQAQQRNNRRIAALQPSGALGEAVQYMTAAGHRYLVGVTHVHTGALRASRRMELDLSTARGRLFTSPVTRNPRSGKLCIDYDPIEEARGGDHAAWARTEAEISQKLLPHGVQIVLNGIRTP